MATEYGGKLRPIPDSEMPPTRPGAKFLAAAAVIVGIVTYFTFWPQIRLYFGF
jgi:hypothetical protein